MKNTELVSRLVDAWNTGKLDNVDNVLSLNFVRHEPDVERRTTSREDYKQTITRYRTLLSDFHTEAVDTIEQGDRVVFRFRTTGKRNNLPVVYEGVNILRIEGDKVVEDWVYLDVTGLQQRLAREKAA
jgi:ketosteroid isomerase-like protein